MTILRKCPDCNAVLLDAGDVCKSCGSDIKKNVQPQPPKIHIDVDKEIEKIRELVK